MRKLTLSLLAGGLLALPVLADTVSTGVNVKSNAGTPFYAAGPDSITGSDGNSYYAAFPNATSTLSIKDWIGRSIAPYAFSNSDNATDLCNDVIDTSNNRSYFDGILVAGITIDPGSVIHLTFDTDGVMTNLSDSNYKITISKVYAHMCYRYNGAWKDISANSTLDSKFNWYDNGTETVLTPSASAAEIDTDVEIPNLTGESQPSQQATIYFIFDPVYQFPQVMKSGTYKADFTITLTAE
jgi:hypothetical protein